MNSEDVKKLVFSLGAQLCGIAGIDRFEDAPKGYHPLDVFPECRSVISFACSFPTAALRCRIPAPYTRIRNSITAKMDGIALDLCIGLEENGIGAVPVPTNESEWDERTGRWRSIISLKHAAQAAGLGTIGRHSLLITPEFGSMVWLGAVLCSAPLEPDEKKEPICQNCGLCVKACPVDALHQAEMNQSACWEHAFGTDKETQSWVISCHRCRDVCPHLLGSRNSPDNRNT